MKKKKRVIPGFGLSFGIVMAMLGLIVIIPLCSLVVFSLKLSFHDFIETVTAPRVLASLQSKHFNGTDCIFDQCCDGTFDCMGTCEVQFSGKAYYGWND